MDLTVAGRAVLSATAAPRMKKAKAEKLFEGVLLNARAVNSDPKAILSIRKIWLFGSMVDESKSDVGDIDFVVEWDRREVVRAKLTSWVDELEQYVRVNYPGLLPDGYDRFHHSAEEIFLARMLYGKRRAPVIAPNSLTTLKDLHRPCRLVFDASRGGIVDDPVLPHHPDSRHRSRTIRPRLKMPELSRVPRGFRPTSIGWLGGRDRNFAARPALAGNLAYQFRPDYKASEDPSRNAFEVVFGPPRRQCVVRVSRGMKASARIWNYVCAVEIVSGAVRLSADDIHLLGKLLDDLVGADGFRLAGRRHDLGKEVMIDFEMQARFDGGKLLSGRFARRVFEAGVGIFSGTIPADCCFSMDCHTEDGDEGVGYMTPEEEAELEEDWAGEG